MKRQHSKKFAVPLVLSFMVLPTLLESGSAVSDQSEECRGLHSKCERAFILSHWGQTPQLCSTAYNMCASCAQACQEVTGAQAEYNYCTAKLRKLQKQCPH
jgi:hypothetical protein